MSDIKPWQIVLIVVALGVLAFSGWRMMGDGIVDGPSGHMTVDVMTGQLYMVQKGKAKGIVYPVKHPDTGERTLYPVVQEDGDWKILGRAVGSITKEMRAESKVLGADTEIEVLDEEPIVIVIRK